MQHYNQGYDELYHVGVLGMKWGKRKKESTEPKSKSKHRQKLEDKYIADGYSPKMAAINAEKRIRTEKVIAITAGLTVAAIATSAAINHYKDSTDSIIKSGKVMQNISTNSNKGVEDAFYASMNNKDNVKYRGLYGTQILTGHKPGTKIYETKIKAVDDLKVASTKSASKVFKELYESDENFKKDVNARLLNARMPTVKQQILASKASIELQSGKPGKNAYELFNMALVDHSTDGAKATAKTFYDTLKQKGYHAIKDINDIKYSGYKAKSATIVFDGVGKLNVDAVRKLGVDEISKNANTALSGLITESLVKAGSIGATGALAALVGKKYVDDSEKIGTKSTTNQDKKVG